MIGFFADGLRWLLDRVPYIAGLRQQVRDAGGFPPGHFYSPVPSRSEAQSRLKSLEADEFTVPDVDYNEKHHAALLEEFAAYYPDLPFPERQDGSCRFHYDQTFFCHPDAIFLYSFLRHAAPSRIIEVGSGFSSAVILDTLERFGTKPTALSFIEPYPDRLHKLLRASDEKKATILSKRVQDTPLEFFSQLGPGDLLFIDSSHVLKTGSDLQYMLFDVLPRLPVGVYVHFHDIFSTFEYPENWVVQWGWYWNEAYFLRAFLAHNDAWEVYLFSNYVRLRFEDYLAAKMPLCLKDRGGSLYLRKTGPRSPAASS